MKQFNPLICSSRRMMSSQRLLQQPAQRILMTGGTGLIGSALTKNLISEGHDVTIYSRQANPSLEVGGPGKLSFVQQIDSIAPSSKYNAIVNLAGAPMAGWRWTDGYKKTLRQSRLGTTIALNKLMKEMETKPQVYVSGSAIGYYGISDDNDTEFTEESLPAETKSFSHTTCQDWESLANEMSNITRVINLRTGVVLDKEGGALGGKMLLPFSLGVGGVIGSGDQIMPWIDIEDMVRIIAFCIDNEAVSGPVNATSPFPVTNYQFTKALGSALNRPTIIPMPDFVVKLLMGQMGDELLLHGHKVLPKKALGTGFEFNYPQLQASLEHVLTK